MPPHSYTLTLSENESKVVEGLTLTHLGGGHKRLTPEDGGGDLSFADIECKIENQEAVIERVFLPKANIESLLVRSTNEEKSHIMVGPYCISIEDVGWNGEPVRLSVTRALA